MDSCRQVWMAVQQVMILSGSPAPVQEQLERALQRQRQFLVWHQVIIRCEQQIIQVPVKDVKERLPLLWIMSNKTSLLR